MFERFSNKARTVLVFAQDEASQLRHNFIGTEHLLLGVVASNDSVVAQAMPEELTVDAVRAAVTALVGPGHEEVVGQPPFTPRAKKVLELSLREALSMGHDSIGVAHILLGILREGEGVGAQVLRDRGVEYDSTRLWIGQATGEVDPRGRRRGRRRFRDDPRLLSAMTTPLNAASLAARQREGLVGTHHMLAALLDQETSMAAQALADLGVTKEKVEAKIAEIGIENTSDAPPKPAPQPTRVALAEGVEIRITDPQLAALVESGQVEELLTEIVRRAKPA